MGWLLTTVGVLGAVAVVLGARSLNHAAIGSLREGVSMYLWRDEDGIVWLDGVRLGVARDELYDVVPVELWGALGKMIAAEEEEQADAREFRAGNEDTYRRNRL